MSIEIRARQYGTVFGDWKFDERIGKGSSGKTAVFRLNRSHLEWHENCALKVVPVIEESGKWEEFSDFFKNDYKKRKQELCKKAEEEVRIMYKIHGSAYVVNYLDFTFHDWKDGNSFGCDMLIRMELLENLREEMKCRTTYTEKEIIQIGKDICRALIYCHKENIIHRDIKPENIFKNKQGDYKLGDFGISRIISRSQSATTMMGTWAYAAPEQFAQNGADSYDYRVDIYSLGLVLYELCNENRLPFAKSNYVREEENQLRIIGKKLEKPCNASSMLSDVILKACAYKPENRYQSATEFLDALDKIENERNEMKDEGYCESEKIKSENLYQTLPAISKNESIISEFEKLLEETKKTDNAEEYYKIGQCYYYGKDVMRNHEEAIKWYEKAAEKGNIEAQRKLINYYCHGSEFEKNYQKAVKWLEAERKRGNAKAEYELGEYYYSFKDEENWKKGEELIFKAAENGCAEAQYKLACWSDYRVGDFDETDRLINEAIKWYTKAAKNNHLDAILWLAEQCEDGMEAYGKTYIKRSIIKLSEYMIKWIKTKKNNIKNLKSELEKLHDGDYAESWYSLGNCFYYGDGVGKDYGEALKYYKKAAEQGNAYAQCMIGIWCENEGKNSEEAIRSYKKAAEQGVTYAQNIVGYYSANRKEIEQDIEKVLEIYKKVAEEGNVYAKNILGIYYYYGEGVEKNYNEAIKWYKEGSIKGNKYASMMVGHCYYYGKGVEQDYKKAIIYYEKAAREEYYGLKESYGEAGAQFALGKCYYYGQGIKINYEYAVDWYIIAVKNGNLDAAEELINCYQQGHGIKKDTNQANRITRLLKKIKKSNEAYNKSLIKELYRLVQRDCYV